MGGELRRPKWPVLGLVRVLGQGVRLEIRVELGTLLFFLPI